MDLHPTIIKTASSTPIAETKCSTHFYMCFCYTIFESPHFGQKYTKQHQTNIQCFPTTCSLNMFLFPFRVFCFATNLCLPKKDGVFFSTEERSFYRQIQILQWSRVTQLGAPSGWRSRFFWRDVTLRKCVSSGIFQRFFIIKVIVVQFVNQVCVCMDGNIIPKPAYDIILDCM